MKRSLVNVFALVAMCAGLVAGCAGGPGQMPSPEGSLAAGANSLAAATTVATVALKNDKITVAQAKSYRTMLGAAGSMLDDANASLLTCRAATKSTYATVPDPCRPTVAGVIGVALDAIANVKRTVDAGK